MVQKVAKQKSPTVKHSSNHHLRNYLDSVFAKGYRCTEPEISFFDIIESDPDFYLTPSMSDYVITQLSKIYCTSTITSQEEADRLQPYFSHLYANSYWRVISNFNKDNEFFKSLTKSYKSTLSQTATTEDVKSLLEKCSRFQDLDAIIKILNENAKKEPNEQSVDTEKLASFVTELVGKKSYNSVFHELDAGGKVLRLMELLKISPAVVDNNFFGGKNNRYKETERNSYGYSQYTGISPDKLKCALSGMGPYWYENLFLSYYSKENIKSLCETWLFNSRDDDQNPSRSQYRTNKFLKNFMSVCASQKGNMKILSFLCGLAREFLEEKQANKMYSKIVSADVKDMPADVDKNIFWFLKFLSVNEKLLEANLPGMKQDIMKTLIKVEEKSLAKMVTKPVAKKQEVKKVSKI